MRSAGESRKPARSWDSPGTCWPPGRAGSRFETGIESYSARRRPLGRKPIAGCCGLTSVRDAQHAPGSGEAILTQNATSHAGIKATPCPASHSEWLLLTRHGSMLTPKWRAAADEDQSNRTRKTAPSGVSVARAISSARFLSSSRTRTRTHQAPVGLLNFSTWAL